MNVGIVTVIGNNNYGNRLQNYALSKYLQLLKCNPITILNDPQSNTKKYFLLRKIKNRNYKGTYSQNINRKNKFESFNKYIKFTDKTYSIYSNFKKFDVFIAGSDQIWNPHHGRLREFDLLSFAPPEKRISYSASIGLNELPEKYFKQVKRELLKFKSISVRETRGKEILEGITGRNDINVLIDPTMLLNAKQWDEVSVEPSQLKNLGIKKYILCYFLGSLSSNRKQQIEKIAKENNCEIINILDESSPFYETGPSEFLYLEKNAFLICTDSFHSCVFSIIYNRPFVIFEREQDGVENMSSRLDTLINKFEIKNRKYNGTEITKENLEHDYTKAYEILEKEREKSYQFLSEALRIKDSD